MGESNPRIESDGMLLGQSKFDRQRSSSGHVPHAGARVPAAVQWRVTLRYHY